MRRVTTKLHCRRVVSATVASFAIAVLLAGCTRSEPGSSSTSSGSSSSAASSSPSASSGSRSSSSSSGATSTESTSTTSPTQTTAAPPNGAGSPELAARGLYDRWAANDRAGARSFATDEAIAEMFARPGSGAAWTFQACDAVSGGAYCNFSYTGGAAQMHVADMSQRSGGAMSGFKVDAIIFTAD